ncbi:MAG TPA: ComEC/Rec2 family competence protein, partial [Cytophagaceae bacterium]|nr:ComEC/Rec2 family competence protein [Cytophagaceae bacterium]
MYFLRSGIPFVRFLIVFMLGLFAGILYSIEPPNTLLFLSIAVYAFFCYLEKKYFYLIFVKSFFAFFILFLLGVVLINARTEKKESDHYTHFLDSIECYKARIVSAPEYTDKTIKITLELKESKVRHSGWQFTCGKMVAYIQKDSALHFKKGAILLILGKPSSAPLMANPAQFNYSNYLARQNIYAVHFIRENEFAEIGYENDFFIIKIADDFRAFCEGKLRLGIKGENEYRMASALILGVRAGLDEKLYEAYSATGTVHALAVSGLHVSLIYFIVVTLFGFIKKTKYGKFIFAALSICIFWFYALVTGFSPSVVRAVAMFSVFLVAGILKRNSGIYNTLGFSAFVILCFEPFWLLDIGFQFSFLAVVGIAYIYPILYSWLETKNKMGNKLWSLVCVSLAAQIAVSPLSIYYFHSFPLLFLPFNMLIVPLSSLALYTGIGGLMVYKIKLFADFLFLITEYVVRFMNYFVQLPSGSEFLKA